MRFRLRLPRRRRSRYRVPRLEFDPQLELDYRRMLADAAPPRRRRASDPPRAA